MLRTQYAASISHRLRYLFAASFKANSVCFPVSNVFDTYPARLLAIVNRVITRPKCPKVVAKPLTKIGDCPCMISRLLVRFPKMVLGQVFMSAKSRLLSREGVCYCSHVVLRILHFLF